MVSTGPSASEKIRSHLSHPVIDTDGHFIEVMPVFEDYVRDVAGGDMVKRLAAERFPTDFPSGRYWRLTPEGRRAEWTSPTPWWALPSDTLDRATAMTPKLLHGRLDEMGLDFSVLYPSVALNMISYPEDDVRRACARAVNLYMADMFGEHADRLTPAAVIPAHTPEEGIEELEFAVGRLGLKAVLVPGQVYRPIEAVHRQHPDLFRYVNRLDHLAMESEYDYDPFWAKCVELKVVPACHSGGMGVGTRRSVNNYMYNHIGHFASVADAFCKAIFFGGLTRKFPALRFAFLECGAGWAVTLYADIVARWQKRGPRNIQRLNPRNLDREAFRGLLEDYGNDRMKDRLDRIIESPMLSGGSGEPYHDDFAATGIEQAEDIRGLFEPYFYFGCEADDPVTASAFNSKANPFGARLRPMLSSDLGHWDVPDMREILEEAYSLVESQALTEDDFRDFAFTNPATLYGGTNPAFFEGTRVESDVARLLAGSR